MYANTPAAQAVVDRMTAYGVQADGEVVTSEYHDGVSYDEQMTLGELVNTHKGHITRVRLLSEVWPGRGRVCDVSYIHGQYQADCPTCSGRPGYSGCGTCLSTGSFTKTVPVRVDMPSGGMGVMLREIKGEFIAWAKAEGVFAKGCGLLDEGTWSVLR